MKRRSPEDEIVFLVERLSRRRARGVKPTLHDFRLETRLEGARQIVESRAKREALAKELAAGTVTEPAQAPAREEMQPTAGEVAELNLEALNARSEVLRKVLRGKGNSFSSRQASKELQEITKLLAALARADATCARACCRRTQRGPARTVRIVERGGIAEADALERAAAGDGSVHVRDWPMEGQKG